MTLRFDIHGVLVEIESSCEVATALVVNEYRHFLLGPEDLGTAPAHVRLELCRQSPRLPDARTRGPLVYRTGGNRAFGAGPRRWVDHQGRAAVDYDFDEERGRIFAETAQRLHEVAYLLIASRVGHELDLRGLHRCHAVALARGGQGALLSAASGCGKSTLGLQLMRDANFDWMGDETPLVGADLELRAYPMAPRLVRGQPAPWPSRTATRYAISRGKAPAKSCLDTEPLLGRVRPRAPLGVAFACSRPGGLRRPRARQLSVAGAWRALAPNFVLGREFPQTKVYLLRIEAAFVAALAGVYVSRARRLTRLVRNVPTVSLELCDDVERNAHFVRDACERWLAGSASR